MSDISDGIHCICDALEVERLTASGWTMVAHYQEESVAAHTESVPMLPAPLNGYQPPVQYTSQIKYLPSTKTFFILKKSLDQSLVEIREALNRETERAGSLEGQVAALLKSHDEHVGRHVELAKECDRLREIVAEPKVAVESFGLLAWSDEVRRIYKIVHGIDCGVTVRCDAGKWAAQAFDGKRAESVNGKDTVEAAAEALLLAMRSELRRHIDKKKTEFDELSTIENVAAVAMTEEKERMPF